MQNGRVPVNGDLDTAIAAMEARLRELDGEREAIARELAELRARQQAASPQVDTAGRVESSWTPQRKLALFADLFRGREDVFPVRWVKPGDGKSGWAPRCENDWKPGICGKLAEPRVKCGECPNQAFRASTEQQLLAHLQGRHVMGVYPLLAEDMCRLLAIDLDKRSWRTDVAAIREACDALGLVPAVERSRSGDGAHVWFFFSEPVGAVQARRLGSMLLTDAMARTPTLSMSSYDRLFPSQDTLPKGGFGNLIALPLQQQARHNGNTVFLDEQLEPHEDQWSYLRSLPRITPERLWELLAHGGDDDGVLEMPGEARDSESPWRGVRPLAQRLAEVELPGALSATLAQRLYLRSEGLPAALLDAMRRLAAFANPEFFELQAMRTPEPRPSRQARCAHLRLRRRRTARPATHVRQAAARIPVTRLQAHRGAVNRHCTQPRAEPVPSHTHPIASSTSQRVRAISRGH